MPVRNIETTYKADEDKLPDYKYIPLKNPDCLRLLRLRPADDEQENIDGEIIEISLFDEQYSSENIEETPNAKVGSRSNSSSRENHPPIPESHDQDAEVDDEESSDDDEERESRETNAAKPEVGTEQIDPQMLKAHNSFEAVSWCWGREPTNEILRIHHQNKVSIFPVSKNLKAALWALRKKNEVRQLWIDAICINQKDVKERNQQVPRMDKIYGKAEKVCIWLGAADKDSKRAIDFIKNKILHLWEFDKLIEDRDMAEHWASLIRLMKRPWFSRRWVVQEIALSPRGGTVFCGKDNISWQDFSDAVSLFVEVESATHRVSDVMKLNQSFGNIPDFFGDVSSLGAALLVDATRNLFRNDRKANSEERKPLSSLEYLVSRLTVFEATEPRDTVYALLAISRDTLPKNIVISSVEGENSQKERLAMNLAPSKGFVQQNYNVDYKLPVIDVYQEFIDFAIKKSDRTRALDIICRPWAPTVLESHNQPGFLGAAIERIKPTKTKVKDQEVPLPSWIPSLSGAALEMEEHPTIGLRMQRQNADPLVGMPEGFGQRNYSAAGDTALPPRYRRFHKWKTVKAPNALYPEYSMFVSGFILDKVNKLDPLASNGNIPYRWLRTGGWLDTDEYPPEDFWRTLVADRGHFGRNPPTYFPRACKESMRFKAKTMSKTGGNLDSRKMINEGRCTIVAEFLRRVQEVIWNRQLMTTEGGRLGLVREDVRPGFLICILYGCSVPVVLQKIKKSDDEMKAEQRDRYQQWKKDVRSIVARIKARYSMKKLRRRRRKEEALKKAIPQLEIPLPSSKESLEWLLRPRKDSWPSKEFRKHVPIDIESWKPFQTTESTSDQSSTGADSLDAAKGTAIIDQHQFAERLNGSKQHLDTEIMNSDIKGDEDESLSVSPIVPKIVRMRTDLEKAQEAKKGAQEYEDHRNFIKNKTPSLSYYRLVGECYVHGMMNGEAIDLKVRKDIPDQMFDLR